MVKEKSLRTQPSESNTLYIQRLSFAKYSKNKNGKLQVDLRSIKVFFPSSRIFRLVIWNGKLNLFFTRIIY